MRRKIERLRRRFREAPSAGRWALPTLVLTAGLFYHGAPAQDIVLVTDSGRRRTPFDGQRPYARGNGGMAGLVAKSTDEIRSTENGNGSSRVTIQRSFPVSVKGPTACG